MFIAQCFRLGGSVVHPLIGRYENEGGVVHFLISILDDVKAIRSLIEEKCNITSYLLCPDFPKDHCLQTSYFLAFYLNKKYPEVQFQLICGVAEGENPIDDVVHWWLECEGFIIDITADQFNVGEFGLAIVNCRPYKRIHYGPITSHPQRQVFKKIDKSSHLFSVDNLPEETIEEYELVLHQIGLVQPKFS